MDRLFDGLTLIPMMLIVAAFAGGDASFPVGFGRSLNFTGLGIVMAGSSARHSPCCLARNVCERQQWLHALLHRCAPGSLKPKVEGLLTSFFDGLHALKARSPGIAFAMSLISWTLEATMYYIVALAFDIHEGFHIFLLLTAARTGDRNRCSQGGVGPFALVVSRTLVAFGVASEAAALRDRPARDVLFPIIAIGCT